MKVGVIAHEFDGGVGIVFVDVLLVNVVCHLSSVTSVRASICPVDVWFKIYDIFWLVDKFDQVYAFCICFIAFTFCVSVDVLVILHVYTAKLIFNHHVCDGVKLFFGIFFPFVVTNDCIFDDVNGNDIGVQVNSGSAITILGVGII